MAARNQLIVLIVTIGVFGILTTEMGVVGLLPAIADYFDVTVSRAGWLVSSFALAVAVAGPIMPLLFSGIDRKRVMLLVLGVFVDVGILSLGFSLAAIVLRNLVMAPSRQLSS